MNCLYDCHGKIVSETTSVYILIGIQRISLITLYKYYNIPMNVISYKISLIVVIFGQVAVF